MSLPLSAAATLPFAGSLATRQGDILLINEGLQQIEGSMLNQHERRLLSEAIRAAKALSSYTPMSLNEEARGIVSLCSLLLDIERFLRQKARRSYFRRFSSCLRFLFNGARIEGYRRRLRLSLDQLDKPQDSTIEAEADIAYIQESQHNATPRSTPQTPQSTPSAATAADQSVLPSEALGSQYSPPTHVGSGLSPVQHPHPPLPPYYPYAYPYPHPYPHPNIIINISNLGNDNRATTIRRFGRR